MPMKRPLCLYDGRIEELRAADGLPADIAYPRRAGTPKIVGDATSASLGTLAMVGSRLYYVPFVVPRAMQLSQLMVSVTAASAGSASIGIYADTSDSGDDLPGELLASVTGLDMGTTGNKSGSVNMVLQQGVTYWAAFISSSGATLRALATGSIRTALGRQSNSTSAVTHLMAAGSGATLPNPAPASLSDGTGSIPAIYMMEV